MTDDRYLGSSHHTLNEVINEVIIIINDVNIVPSPSSLLHLLFLPLQHHVKVRNKISATASANTTIDTTNTAIDTTNTTKILQTLPLIIHYIYYCHLFVQPDNLSADLSWLPKMLHCK